jgi:hypothetical protein
MALILVVEDGSGLANANSYASVADGDAYHDAHLYATGWTAATTPNKEKALAMATRLIDEEFQFNGYRANSSQALQWPRVRCPDPDAGGSTVVILASMPNVEAYVASDKVPVRVVQATCEMARELLIADRTGPPAGEGISMQRNADLSEIVYNKKDRSPIITCVAQNLLCKYGAMLRKAAWVRLVRS